MTLQSKPPSGAEKIPVIDVDFHPMPRQWDQEVLKFLPRRWKDYIAKYGLGAGGGIYTGSPPAREFTHRLDAIDMNGRVGTDPLFAKKQVLDEYDLTWRERPHERAAQDDGPDRLSRPLYRHREERPRAAGLPQRLRPLA